MTTQAELTSSSLSWWERLVGVSSPDPEIARRGRVFNILMVLSAGLVTYIATLFGISYGLGYVELRTTLMAIAFPLAFVPISFALLAFAKRGYVRLVVPLYVWINFVGIALAAFVFDGSTSIAWLLYFWTITIAGTLIAPRYSLIMTGIVLGYYLLLWAAQQSGIYTPPVRLSPQAQTFQTMGFILGLLVTTAGLLTYLNMRSLNHALGSLIATTEELEHSQQQLEQRVAERTEALQRQAKQFRAIVEVEQGLAGITELPVLLQRAVELVSAHFGYPYAALYLVDDVQEWLRLRAVSGPDGAARFAARRNIRLGELSLWSSALTTGRAQLADPASLSVWATEDGPVIRSEIVLPLRAAGRAIGVLDILHVQADVFDQPAREALGIMASDLASMIERTQLFTEMQSSLERLGRYQEAEAVRGWRLALARRNRPLDYTYDRVAVQPGLPDDVRWLMGAERRDALEVVEHDDRYWLLAPLRVQQQLVGTLAFESPRPWTEDQRQLVRTVMDQLGLALENARLLEDTRLSAQRERARSEIVGRVRASVQIDAILRTAVEELGRALQVDTARIQLLPPPSKAGTTPGGQG